MALNGSRAADTVATFHRAIAELLTRTGATYAAIIRHSGRCEASKGEPPCAASRVPPLTLTIAEGSSVLLESGRFERASVEMQNGSLHVHRIDRERFLSLFTRQAIPHATLEDAVAALRKDVGGI